jgi:sepiapterin reductase
MSTTTALVIVTGASRGIGKAVALAFACSSQWPSTTTELRVALVARSEEGLEQTKHDIMAAAVMAKKDALNLNISCHVADLSKTDNTDGEVGTTIPLERTVSQLFESLSANENPYQHAILINNAGSVEPIGAASTVHKRYPQIRESFDFNISSSVYLSSAFADKFGSSSQSQSPESSSARKAVTIVNMSSLCAVEPFKSMAIYCAGKAARDMFHKVLAEETKEEGLIKVLNYAPGPVATEMVATMIDSTSIDSGIKEYMSSSRAEGTLVKADDTARKLVGLVLESNKFESGSHVDYFDV